MLVPPLLNEFGEEMFMLAYKQFLCYIIHNANKYVKGYKGEKGGLERQHKSHLIYACNAH